MSSNDELVDVVDATGQVVRVVTRREMREQRLPHRCVYILVFNQQGALFLHQRTITKDVYPGYWDCAVGGVLTAGEGFAEGAKREGGEELGVEVEPEELFPFQYSATSSSVWGMVYRAQHDGPFQLQPEEILQGRFAHWEEVDRRIAAEAFCPDGLQVLAEYRRRFPANAF